MIVNALRYRRGPGYLEMPQSTGGLLKSLILAVAGFLAFLVERKLETEWGLVAEGFYVMRGIVICLFLGALGYLLFSQVVRFEVGLNRIVVKRGIRVLHVVPVMLSYDCDELRIQHVKGRTTDGRHVQSMAVWKITGAQRRRSLLGFLFADLAVFSKRQDAIEFMRQALQFAKSAGVALPSSSEQVVRLTP